LDRNARLGGPEGIKAELINCALLQALKNLLKQVLSSQGLSYCEREKRAVS
jgi:hypothetical protein